MLVNAFDVMEPESVASLKRGAVVPDLAPVFAVESLVPVDFRHPEEAGKEQIFPLHGLALAWHLAGTRQPRGRYMSGNRFFWIVKGGVVTCSARSS